MLPQGIKLYGEQIVLDIGSFLQTPEQKRMLELVKSVEMSTSEGMLILNVKIEIN